VRCAPFPVQAWRNGRRHKDPCLDLLYTYFGKRIVPPRIESWSEAFTYRPLRESR
jgi:hypothetical protein